MSDTYKAGETIQGGPWDGFEVLSTYTRAQALEDGTLIDVTAQAKPRSITIPCAVTAGVWGHITEGLKDWETDQIENRLAMMRLADVIAAMREAAALEAVRGTRSDRVFFTQGGKELWAIVGPGDTAAPVMTIMLVGED